MTAFGAPVVPLEYCQKHMSVSLVGAAVTWPGRSSKRSASASVTVRVAPESRSMKSSSSGRANVDSGTGIAPIFAAPRNAAMHQGESRRTKATRAPGRTSRSRTPSAAEHVEPDDVPLVDGELRRDLPLWGCHHLLELLLPVRDVP